jgi:acyl-CoA reductase-like NAD-dependent aldehyde dehydrogenase
MSTLTTHERTVVSAVPTGLWIGGDVVPGSRGTLDVHDPATGAVLTEVAYAGEFLRWFSEEAVRIYDRWSVAPDRNSRLLTMKQPIGVGLGT